MKIMASAVLLLLMCCSAFAADNPEQQVRAVLQAQAEAWNKGDLETYMQGYWHSPDVTFYSGGALTRGFDETLARYRRGYQAPGREMGHLEFPEINVLMLAPDAALVRGSFQLKMKSGQQPHGLFTVIMKKLPEGWRIIHDHSSVAQ